MLGIIKDKDGLIAPFAKAMPTWIHPNAVTLARVVLIPIVVALVLMGYIEVATLIVLFGFFLDALDGTMARLRKLHTDFGSIMDPVADKGLFLVAFISIGVYTLPFKLVLAVLIGETVMIVGSALFGLLFRLFGVERHLGANIFGKLKTVIQIVAMALLGLGYRFPLIVDAAIVLFWFSLVLLFASIVRHMLTESNSD